MNKLRAAKEWIQIAEALIFSGSLQEHVGSIEGTTSDGKSLSLAVMTDIQLAYYKLTELYRKQMDIDPATWKVATQRPW